MNSPATRQDLHDVRTELRTEIQDVRTELRTEIQHVRTELRAEIHEVRTDLEAKIDSAVTASEQRIVAFVADSLERVVGGAEARILAAVAATAEASERRMMAELGRHTRSSQDELTTRIDAVDEHYAGLPARITRLEAKVFPED